MTEGVITPSKPNWWVGTPGGRGMTVEQRITVERMRWRGEMFDVRISTYHHNPGDWMGQNIVTTHPCPVIVTTKTLRKVITPCGLEKWITRGGLNL